MTDYGRIYRGVPYFGVWAAESADEYGRRDAATVLAGAVELCMDEDMRDSCEVRAALAYFVSQGQAKRAAAFRRALDIPSPIERRDRTAQAYDALLGSLHLVDTATD